MKEAAAAVSGPHHIPPPPAGPTCLYSICPFTMSYVARVDTGGGDAAAHLPRARFRVRHLAADQDVTGRPCFSYQAALIVCHDTAAAGRHPSPGEARVRLDTASGPPGVVVGCGFPGTMR